MNVMEHLRDPDWWFNIVVAGIVVGVSASFVKDWVVLLAGSLSRKLKQRQEFRKARQLALIEALADDPVYLSLEWNRVLLQAVMFIGTTIIFLLLPLAQGGQECTALAACGAMQALVSITVYPFFGGLSIASGYKASSRLKPLSRALKLYREKNDLPNLP